MPGWRVSDGSYFFEGCFSAIQSAICWQNKSSQDVGKRRVSSALEHTALKYGCLVPTNLFSLQGKCCDCNNTRFPIIISYTFNFSNACREMALG